MSLGPIMLDVPGVALTDDDRRRLAHPLVGGVILFARNYHVARATACADGEIRALRTPHLLIAVDHEGGRVQRFRDGFTVLPPMRELGKIWDRASGAGAATGARMRLRAGRRIARARRGSELYAGARSGLRRIRRDRRPCLSQRSRCGRRPRASHRCSG